MITNLKCEYKNNPLGVEQKKPMLQWVIKGATQKAYRVCVATREALLEAPDLWDSEKIETGETYSIYGGIPIPSNQKVYWRVCVWDAESEFPTWSDTVFWRQGMLKEDWKAKWIGYDEGRSEYDPNVPYYCADDYDLGKNHPFLPKPALLRREFELNDQVLAATLYVSAMGLTEMYLNGEKATEAHMLPGNCDYRKRAYYRAFDVTQKLNRGRNAISAVLADGWYAGYIGLNPREWWGSKPRLSAELVLEYADGSIQTLVTDQKWTACVGPWLYADIMHGTGYDATLEPEGWKCAGFDDTMWHSVDTDSEYDHIPSAHPGVSIVEHFRCAAKRIIEINENEAIFDMGVCLAGVVCARVKGERGATIEFDHAEELNEAKTELHYKGNRSAKAHDTYILSGKGVEIFQPEFTYHGFRYVHVFGLRNVELISLEGVAISSELPEKTLIESQNETVNTVLRLIRATEQSNLYDMPTDVCARDERIGWGTEGNLFMNTACMLNNSALFLRKWLQDALDGQMDNGGMWAIAPAVIMKDIVPFMGDLQSNMALHLAWLLMRNYNDLRTVEAAYPALVESFEYSLRNSDRYLRFATGRDWLDLNHEGHSDYDHGYGKCDPTLLGTAWFAKCAQMMRDISLALSKADRAAYYEDVYGKIRNAFRTFFMGRNRLLRGVTQGGYLLAAEAGMLEGEEITAAREWIREDMRKHGGVTWGTATTPVALQGMCKLGLEKEAAAFIRSREFPSIGYMAENGATAVWERWDAIRNGRFHPHAMNAFNHIGLSTVGEWIVTSLVGIAPEKNGYDVIRFKPVLDREIGGMRAALQTIHGLVEFEWSLENEAVHLKALVPHGAVGRLILPDEFDEIHSVSGNKDIAGTSSADGETAISLEAGQHEFIVKTQ